MKDFRVDLMARAAVTRIENTMPERIEDIGPAMGSYADSMTKPELVEVVGYLAKWVLSQEASR